MHSARRIRRLTASASIICLACALPCTGAQRWVSPAGDDAAPGTAARPFRTIGEAVSVAAPGDTVLVKAGRYEECVSIGKERSGRPEQWLTVAAAPGDERKVTVGVEEPRVDAYGSQSSAFVLLEVQYVRLRGLKCVAPYRGRGSGIGARKSKHIEILNCVVTGGGQGGLDLNHCDYVTVDGVEAYFNGGGTGWSSGISLLEPGSRNNVVRNCICYGNYDRSSYRSDGSGIIIDNGYGTGGALVVNNLTFMNGGKGMCSTRSDHCIFLNNTSVANCWQPNQQDTAHELSIRGRRNLVRNNIGVAGLPKGVGMQALLSYGSPKGKVTIDSKSIICDHNLFYNPKQPTCVVAAGDRGRKLLSMAALRKALPHWAGESLSVDPRFVDALNLDFRLRPDSPALRAGISQPQGGADILGSPRPKSGPCSLGCYEGAWDGKSPPRPKPAVVIAVEADRAFIEALLRSEYELEWHGMLWGWGKLLPEELPLQIEIQGPRKADFLNLSGRFVLAELLERIAREHQVRLLLRRPSGSEGVNHRPHVVSNRLSVGADAGADERAFVRRALRTCVWTEDSNGKSSLADLLPALSAALGVRIESRPTMPAGRRFPMVTRNMRFSAFLSDIARRLDVQLILSRHDPLSDPARVQSVRIDTPFGGENGLVSLTVDQPDGRGRIDLFARVQPKACLCARLFTNNSRFIAPAGIDDQGAGSMYRKAATRLDRGTVVRLAVAGRGCALNVGGEWVLLNQLPPSLRAGGFHVRAVSKWVKVSNVRYVPLEGSAGVAGPRDR